MKKIEAQELAPEKSKLVIEYITKKLLDGKNNNIEMKFGSEKIDGQQICILDTYVSEKQFEERLNLGITYDHNLVLYEQLLNDFVNNFLESDTIGVTRYYCIKSMQGTFSGVNIVDINGSKIKINFNTTHPDFMNIVSEYLRMYDEFENTLKNQSNENKIHR